MKNNFYEIVKNNGEKESELKVKREEEREKVRIILKKDAYSKYKYYMQEFPSFISSVINNYSDLNTKLTNVSLDNISISYSSYNKEYNYKHLQEFLNKYALGTIECNSIIWNKNKTVKNFIDAYYQELTLLEERLVTIEDLKEQYLDLLEHDKEVYGSLISDKLYKYYYLKNCDFNNISCKILYYLQYWFEKYNYNLGSFDTREYDISVYDGSAIWEECHPDPTFHNFYYKEIQLSSTLYKLLEGTTKFDINTIEKEDLEKLIRDIKALELPDDLEKPVEKVEQPREAKKVNVSRSRIYKNNHNRQ